MKQKIGMLFGFFIIFFLVGCSQTVRVKALEPAQVDRVSTTKKISVAAFHNDTVGLAQKVEANLANVKINNKKYFTLVSRKDFEKIVQEQKLQSSGLIEP